MNNRKRYIGVGTPLLVLLVLSLLAVPGFASGRDESRTTLEVAYLPNAKDGTISSIDLITGDVTGTIEIGAIAAHGIAATPDGRIVYAGDAERNELVIIDGKAMEIVYRVPLDHEVHGIDISPDGQTVWVGGSAGNDPLRGTVTAVDTASGSVIRVVSPGLGSASHFSLTPDGTELWIASTSTNLVWVVETETGSLSGVIPVASGTDVERMGDGWGSFLDEQGLIGLNEVAVSPDGRWAWAIGPATSRLYKIDVPRKRVESAVPVGSRGHGVTVSPSGDEVWIADWSGEVIIVDAGSLEILDTIVLPNSGVEGERGANHIAFGPDGEKVYVTTNEGVATIASASRTVLSTVATGAEPHEISLEDWIAEDAWVDSEGILNSLRAVRETASQTMPQVDGEDLTRVNQERAVTIAITPLPMEKGSTGAAFSVSMNTHSVNLDFDLTERAILRDAGGEEYRPSGWDAPAGGHHVSGTLRFDDVDDDALREGGSYQIVITGVAGAPERAFRWGE
ncbi:MAG: YncE family protein [Alkalispirochaeta sp.]